MNFFLSLILFTNYIIIPSTALNQIGCLINEKYCESFEYCLNDSLLGMCVSEQDIFSKKSIRSEEAIDTITPFINSPIRIHKYNQEIDDDSNEENYSDESLEKRDSESLEEERFRMQDPLSLFINLKKRPTIGYFYKEDSNELEPENEYKEPESIEELIETLQKNKLESNDVYQDESTSDEFSNESSDQYNDELSLNLKKREALYEDYETDDSDEQQDEILYKTIDREPRIIRWFYSNQFSNEPIDQNEDVLLKNLKSTLEKNLVIEKIFKSIINNISSDEASNRNLKTKESRDMLLFGISELNSKSNSENNLIPKDDDIKKMGKLFSSNDMDLFSENGQFDIIDGSYVFIELDKKINLSDAENILKNIALITSLDIESIQDIKTDENLIIFKVNSKVNSTDLVTKLFDNQFEITKETGLKIVSCGIGKDNHRFSIESHPLNINTNTRKFALFTLIACATITLFILILIGLFCYKRRKYLAEKLIKDVGYSKSEDIEKLVEDEKKNNSKCSFFSLFCRNKSQDSEKKQSLSNQDYQELCRQRMQNSMNKNSSIKTTVCSSLNESISSNSINSPNLIRESKSESPRSSTSSWSEEPINSFNIDITTGHVILGYMEEHLNDKNRLNKDWEYLSTYTAEPNKTDIGSLPQNMTKNRYSNILPYDHTRVKLSENKENDYINANLIIDDDPKNPAYIATQGPLIHTSGDFWQMVWEQKSVVIVSLCRTVEYGSLKCNQYWPCNGFEIFDKFEIHLVSEHVWCEDYLVRNFFLKNLETNQTRTITQFHFLTWPENGIPQNIKSILDFRSDGIGRAGTYILIDMVLNKIQRGAKEIDLAATLEFLRDQRPGMVKNKTQFEFSFAVVIEEIQNMLKALTQ